MDSVVKSRVKAFMDGLIKLAAETGVELDTDQGEMDVWCRRTRRHLGSLVVCADSYEFWNFGEEPEYTTKRPEGEDDPKP
jgi:hypothetical protein